MRHWRSGTRAAYTLALLISFVIAPSTARSQDSSQQATRRLLLDQADAARTAGHHDEALDRARRAGELEMTPSLRMFIAQEEEATGHLAPALGDAELCVRETERDQTVRNRDAILAGCEALVTSLHPRVGMLVVRVPTPTPSGLRVTVAGVALDPALYGVQNVVTPGDVVVEASAPGRAAFHISRVVGAGATESVDVDVSTAGSGPTTATTASASAAPAESSASPAPSGTPSQGFGTLRLVGAAAAVVGVVVAVIGAGLWVGTNSTYNMCAQVGCDPSTEPRAEDSAAVVMGWGGAVLAIAGAALFVFGPSPHADQPRQASRRGGVTGIWADSHGLGIVGRF